MFPLKMCVFPNAFSPGSFGFERKHDVHCGVDLYTKEGAEVVAIEDGEVVRVDIFTGPKIGMDWWNETWAVMVEGESGVINYGEIQPSCVVGQKVKAGEVLGKVIPVLPPEKIRPDIIGHSCSMLHVELYQHGHREFAIWKLGYPRPEGLFDPTPLLEKTKK